MRRLDRLNRHAPRALLGVALSLVAGASLVKAAPQPYFFEATYLVLSDDPNKISRWNAELNTTISGVMIYDPVKYTGGATPIPGNAGNVDVTGTPGYPSQFAGYDKRYIFPSQTRVPDPSSADDNMDGVPDGTLVERGLNGFNYVISNGYTFRRRLDYPSPMEWKVVNDFPYAPGVFGDALEIKDNMKLEATGDTSQGRTIEFIFIDVPLGGGTAASVTNTDVLPSVDSADYQTAPGVGWGIANDGNLAFFNDYDPEQHATRSVRAIRFGDANGDGNAVTASDFTALAANFLKPAGTYGGGPNHPIGAAIWTDGDFNVDGLVNLDDLKLFINPSQFGLGPRNFADGDVNFDGTVDIFDVNVVSDNWGSTTSPWGDANTDGVVDIFDVNVISDNWGAGGGGAAAAVPEPATMALAVVGLLSLFPLARRRLHGR